MTRTRRRTRMSIPRSRRGYARTSGFYGRFGGAGAERKFFDRDLEDPVVDSDGTVSGTLIAIPQGTGESERIGRKITIRHLYWYVSLVKLAASSSTNSSDTVRIMLIQDRQCNGATPGTLDILVDTDYRAFYNLTNRSRFRFLVDKTYAMTCPSGTGTDTTGLLWGEAAKHLVFNIPLAIPIEYDGVTGGITEIRSNNIIALFISRKGTINLHSKLRFRYTDR